MISLEGYPASRSHFQLVNPFSVYNSHIRQWFCFATSLHCFSYRVAFAASDGRSHFSCPFLLPTAPGGTKGLSTTAYTPASFNNEQLQTKWFSPKEQKALLTNIFISGTHS